MRAAARSQSLSSKSTTGRAAACLLTIFLMIASYNPFLRAQEQRPGPAAECPGCGEAAALERGGEHVQHTVDEITLEPCDRLPMVKLQADGAEKYFLVDTAATSLANLNSF